MSQWRMRVQVLALVAFLVACGGAAPTATTQLPQASATAARASSAPSAASGSAAASVAPAGSAAPGATPTRAAAPATPAVAGTPGATVYPLTIADDAGRSVTVPKRPVRIVSLAPSNTEILYALGLADRVVGVDQFSNYPPEAQSKPKIGSYSAANLEQVVAREPDLILASGITRPDVLNALSAQGLPVVVLNPSNLTGVLANVTLVGRVTDVGAGAGQLRAGLEARIAAVAEKLKGTNTKPRAFVELDPMQFFSVGPKSFVDDLITRAGGVNIAADTGTPYPQLSQEQILGKDPEVILLADGSQGVTPASVQGRAGWGNVSAVKSGRIVVLDEDVFLRSGPRSVDALEMLLRYLHPELFR
ncbi:MAG: ABC transporter substrate-binding protein [Chloroflexia bacterium]